MWDKIFPRSFENTKIYGLGLEAYNMGDFKGAVKCFKKVIEKEPDVSSCWYLLLESLSYLGKWEEMIEIGDKALKIHPNIGPNYSWLGDACDQLGKRKQAIDFYEKALNLLEKELDLMEKKLVKYPLKADGTVLNSLGEINIRLGNYKAAISYSKRASKISPSEHNWHSIGLAFKKLGEYDKAIEFFKKSLDINPKHSYAWFDLGLIYEDLNNTQEAIECYEKAVENSPQWVILREKLLKLKPESLALLKKASDIGILFDEKIAQQQAKSEVVFNDLNELEKILNDKNLTVEERTYFEQRKKVLIEELQLDRVTRQDKLSQLKNLLTEASDLMLKIKQTSRNERKKDLYQRLRVLSKAVEAKRKEIYNTEKTLQSALKIPLSELSPKENRLLWELMKFSPDDLTEIMKLMNQEMDFYKDMRAKLGPSKTWAVVDSLIKERKERREKQEKKREKKEKKRKKRKSVGIGFTKKKR